MKCNGCKAHCCKKFIKFITIHDASRIMDALKIDATDFLDLRPAEGILCNYPKILIKDKPLFLALDSKMGKNDCIFLLEINHVRKCGIYHFRPLGCKTYPYELGEEGLETVETIMCPWQYWPEDEERKEYIGNINQLQQEYQEYNEIVEAWNQEHGETGHYIKFLDFAFKILNKLQGKDEGEGNVGNDNVETDDGWKYEYKMESEVENDDYFENDNEVEDNDVVLENESLDKESLDDKGIDDEGYIWIEDKKIIVKDNDVEEKDIKFILLMDCLKGEISGTESTMPPIF